MGFKAYNIDPKLSCHDTSLILHFSINLVSSSVGCLLNHKNIRRPNLKKLLLIYFILNLALKPARSV